MAQEKVQASVSGAQVFKPRGGRLFLYDHCGPVHRYYTGNKIAVQR